VQEPLTGWASPARSGAFPQSPGNQTGFCLPRPCDSPSEVAKRLPSPAFFAAFLLLHGANADGMRRIRNIQGPATTVFPTVASLEESGTSESRKPSSEGPFSRRAWDSNPQVLADNGFQARETASLTNPLRPSWL